MEKNQLLDDIWFNFSKNILQIQGKFFKGYVIIRLLVDINQRILFLNNRFLSSIIRQYSTYSLLWELNVCSVIKLEDILEREVTQVIFQNPLNHFKDLV